VLTALLQLRYVGLEGAGAAASDAPSLPSGCELAIETGRAPLRAAAVANPTVRPRHDRPTSRRSASAMIQTVRPRRITSCESGKRSARIGLECVDGARDIATAPWTFGVHLDFGRPAEHLAAHARANAIGGSDAACQIEPDVSIEA
jgi:hypothetical protein